MVSARFPVRSHGPSEPLDESLRHLLHRLGSTGFRGWGKGCRRTRRLRRARVAGDHLPAGFRPPVGPGYGPAALDRTAAVSTTGTGRTSVPALRFGSASQISATFARQAKTTATRGTAPVNRRRKR